MRWLLTGVVALGIGGTILSFVGMRQRADKLLLITGRDSLVYAFFRSRQLAIIASVINVFAMFVPSLVLNRGLVIPYNELAFLLGMGLFGLAFVLYILSERINYRRLIRLSYDALKAEMDTLIAYERSNWGSTIFLLLVVLIQSGEPLVIPPQALNNWLHFSVVLTAVFSVGFSVFSMWYNRRWLRRLEILRPAVPNWSERERGKYG